MKRATALTITSRPGHLVCPVCESGELQQPAPGQVSCALCGCRFTGAVLKILVGITALPEVQGKHACEECHHPQMRLLPDGVFHCPACGSEVLPSAVGPT